jgi:soluble lytic murein transglycosylase
MTHRRHLAFLGPLILYALISLACTIQIPAEEPVVAPTTAVAIVVDPTDTSTHTPTLTLTPTPTLTPSPTPPPAVRLHEAERAVHDGDFDAAIAEYQGVLSGSSADALTEQAQFGLGRISLIKGDLLTAENALTQFIDSHPENDRLADAWFMLGEARYAANNYTGAIDAYRQYLTLRGDVIESYVQERIGDAYTAAGDRDAAVEALERAIVVAPNTSIAAAQREKLALLYRLSGDNDEAVNQYRAILDFAQIASYRAHVMLSLGQTLIDDGDDSGYAVFTELINTYPRTGEAHEALVALVNAGAPVDPFQRGLVNYYAGQYTAAVAAFSAFIDATEDHGDAHYYLGLSYREAGNYASAIAQFETLIDDHPDSAFFGEAWIAIAVAQSNAGDLNGAVNTLQQFAEEYPSARLAPNALNRAGVLLERAADYERAADLYRTTQDVYPDDEAAPDALYAAGVNDYRANRVQAARNAWIELSDTYPATTFYAAALLWQGKLLLNAGDIDNAQELLDRAAQAEPFGYYGIRAAEMRDQRAILSSPPAALDIDPDADRLAAETWLAGWAQPESAEANLGDLPVEVQQDGRFQRGAELWRLGRIDQAKSEFENLRQALADDPLALYALSLYWRDIGLYRSSLLAAVRLIAISPAKNAANAPVFIARLAYPIYYADLLVPKAEQYSLDPLLMFALMRQESLFEGFATSSAFANGLMQVVPSTGREIAAALGWPNYTTSDLHKPYVSVAFGAYYLAQQRDLFDGDLYAALAAYNGGPGNALRWHDASGGDPDLFLETITLLETRTYLLRIREHLAMYQRLYAAE